MACCMMYRGGLDVLGCWAVVASPKVCRRYHNVYGKIMRKSFEMSCFLIFHVKITRDMQRCSQLGISCEEMWCQRMWTQQWPPSRPNAPFSSWIGAPLASSVASTISHLLQLARSKKRIMNFGRFLKLSIIGERVNIMYEYKSCFDLFFWWTSRHKPRWFLEEIWPRSCAPAAWFRTPRCLWQNFFAEGPRCHPRNRKHSERGERMWTVHHGFTLWLCQNSYWKWP